LPKDAGIPGMIKRNIMIIPWRVKRELYVPAVTIVFPGAMSSSLMKKPIVTPMTKKVRMDIR
jgi:hypothetical protein